MEDPDLYGGENLNVATIQFSPPVTGLAASFGSVPTKSVFKKCVAYFLKEAKAAAFRLRSPPAVEAIVAN
ncbi:MAG: hypothetical protein JWP81_1597 [Ferruginibacter sp.]|nr:hypothetical protein [Ferruginibacter sp.]